MHDHDYDTTDERRRGGSIAPGERDNAWEAARRALAAGDGTGMPSGAMLHLQRLAGNASVGSLVAHDEEEATSPVLDVVGKGGGSPLPTGVRSDLEHQLGADFADVRVHDDGSAAASAAAVDAKAYTVGNEVVFNSGSYQPDSDEGRRTLAHELTHVVQQRSGPVDGTPTGDGVALSHPEDRFEQEAEAKAASLGAANDLSTTTPAAGAVAAVPAQRQEPEEEEEPVQTLALQRQEEVPEEEELAT